MSLRSRRLGACSGAAAATIAAVIAFAAGSHSDEQANAQASANAGPSPFALLATAAPSSATVATSPFRAGRGGLVDPTTARTFAHGGRTFWAAVGNQRVCVTATSAYDPGNTFGACATRAQAADAGVIAVSVPAPGVTRARALPADAAEVAGLVPDGVGSVEVKQTDGSIKDATVTDNTFAVSLSAAPDSARFASPSGTHFVRLNNK